MKISSLVSLFLFVCGCTDSSGSDYPVGISGYPSPDASPAVARKCSNIAEILSGGNETLTVAFACGSYDAGPALVTLVSNSARFPFDYNFVCGNNFLTFPASTLTLATEITAQYFDIVCN